ncbi:MAG: ABC transporter substrate-binding protein [Betaproteobacteria bacterium]|nr:ABC transporter substrate-binding protein [Betaproteobacteria bacterium]
MKLSKTWGRWAAFGAALMVCGAVSAQIRVGQTAGVTGAVADSVKETIEGAEFAINAANARGGVNGQKIELITLDDKFDPKLAAENARVLIEEKNVSLMFLTRGTPHTQAILPLLEKDHIALLAPSTGAMVFHTPVNPYVFNVRATYQREAQLAIEQEGTVGLTRIAVLHVDDSFGKDALTGALKGFDKVNLKPLFVEKFDRSKPDFHAVAERAAREQPQAVLFIGSGKAVADGVKAMRAAGATAQMITLSNNASGGFIKELGEYAHGTIVTQVFPSERDLSNPLVREATELARARGIKAVTPAMLEGYAAGKVLVEALKRAGPNPSRDKIIKTLDNLRDFDLGAGLRVSYSPTDHTGLTYADLSIIGAGGTFRR